MRVPRLTPHKVECLNLIGKRNPDGSCIDVGEIMERLSYETTKSATSFTLKFLRLDGLIERRDRELRRGQWRAVYALTANGYEYFNKGV